MIYRLRWWLADVLEGLSIWLEQRADAVRPAWRFDDDVPRWEIFRILGRDR